MDGSLAPTTLCTFRTALHACFTRRRDALFELADALLTGGPSPSPVHLSLAPIHRRGWGSLYAALACGRIDTAALQAFIARTAPPDSPPVYAVDVSVWPRCDAETSPGRGFYYHPSRHSAGQPIVAGWAYQWVAQLGFARDSWTAPVDVRRVHPAENAHAIATEQIQALLRRRPAAACPPLFVFDAGYDPEWLARELGDLPVAVLVRLRRGRCFYADPPRATPSPKGGR
jgi:DDE superfamily endonuclease